MTTKTPIATDKAPAAIGPYSQAISANGLLFVSGQTPIDPATGQWSSARSKSIPAASSTTCGRFWRPPASA